MLTDEQISNCVVKIAEAINGLSFSDAKKVLDITKGCLNEMIEKEVESRCFSIDNPDWKQKVSEDFYYNDAVESRCMKVLLDALNNPPSL